MLLPPPPLPSPNVPRGTVCWSGGNSLDVVKRGCIVVLGEMTWEE